MSHAAAAVDHMDQRIQAFVEQHGSKPRGILLGISLAQELAQQGRISQEPVQARLTTSRYGDSPWTVEAGTWPVLDKTILLHITMDDWACFLPPSP
jgi:hypothetical protein